MNSADEEAIRDVLDAWHAATIEGDVDALASIVTEKVVVLAAGSAPIRGRAALLQHVGSATRRLDAAWEPNDLVVRGSTAHCCFRVSVVELAEGGKQRIAKAGHALTILHRQKDGAWKVAREAEMLTRSFGHGRRGGLSDGWEADSSPD